MESVHVQGHVHYKNARFDPRHLVEGKLPHLHGKKTHDPNSIR